MNDYKLLDICDVFIGISRFKTNAKEITSINGLYSYRLYRNTNANSFILDKENISVDECFFENEISSKNLILKGDILAKLIFPFKFILVDEKIDKLVVPSQYCILRIVDKNKIEPIQLWTYLNLFFNKEIKQFSNNTFGLSSIKLNDLKEKSININKIPKNKANLFYKNIILQQLYSKKKDKLNLLVNSILSKRG